METTYARARLWTGISGVGTFVVLAATLLLLDVPTRVLAGSGGAALSDALALAAVLAVCAVATLPFDVAGGLVLPRRFGRPHPSAARFARGWARGVAVLVALSTLSGTLLLAAGRGGGRFAALLAFVAISAAMLALQEPLARWVGGLRRAATTDTLGEDARSVVLLDGNDPAFCGGFTGGSARVVLPAAWLRALGPDRVRLLIERRRRILSAGAWRRSQVLASAWNATGFLLASLLPGAGVSTVAELVTTALGFTLWTFVGLLVLPTPSRHATRLADARVADREAARAELAATIRDLDRLQDDEPERAAGVESVFHPVPSVRTRLEGLASAGRAPGAGRGTWHFARTALFLSHAGLSLLPRVVHCNAGRPELWVYLPADG